MSSFPCRLVFCGGGQLIAGEASPSPLIFKNVHCTINLFLEGLGEILIFRARRSYELVSPLQVSSAIDLHLEALCFLVRLLSE